MKIKMQQILLFLANLLIKLLYNNKFFLIPLLKTIQKHLPKIIKKMMTTDI